MHSGPMNGTSGYDLSDLKVLICDDSFHMRQLIQAFLEGFGIRDVFLACDADEGYEELCNVDPDLVITDWNMEPTNGLDFVRKIRRGEQTPNSFIPIIMLTGYTELIRVEEARDAGVSAFLAKPISAAGLYKRLINVVEDHRIFVRSEGGYFGPDRRSRRRPGYTGDERRKLRTVDGQIAEGT